MRVLRPRDPLLLTRITFRSTYEDVSVRAMYNNLLPALIEATSALDPESKDSGAQDKKAKVGVQNMAGLLRS